MEGSLQFAQKHIPALPPRPPRPLVHVFPPSPPSPPLPPPSAGSTGRGEERKEKKQSPAASGARTAKTEPRASHPQQGERAREGGEAVRGEGEGVREPPHKAHPWIAREQRFPPLSSLSRNSHPLHLIPPLFHTPPVWEKNAPRGGPIGSPLTPFPLSPPLPLCTPALPHRPRTAPPPTPRSSPSPSPSPPLSPTHTARQ